MNRDQPKNEPGSAKNEPGSAKNERDQLSLPYDRCLFQFQIDRGNCNGPIVSF
jgi:hypothetical protein